MPEVANEAQRQYWNNEVRIDAWRRREPMTLAVTPTLLEHAAPARGERVLDIGCGGGRTTIAAAGLAGPEGAATGADISEPLLELARERAAAAGAGNVCFTLADMQSAGPEGGPFDLAMSQFGVMFFDESVTAFANIRAQVRPGGRLVFACWQALADNPWFVGPIVAPFVPPPVPPAPGKNPTGPFAFADPGYTTGILTEAGWTDVERTPHQLKVTVKVDALLDGKPMLRYFGVTEDQLDEARAACERHLAPLLIDDGRYEAPLALQVFSARRR
jgi:SAM-dependent methyltransferase